MDEDIFNESELFSTFDSVENGDKNAAFNCSQARSESANLSELDSLKLENMLLKKLVKKISFNPSEDEPFANILFYKSACKKQREVEDFICHVVKRSAQNNNTQDLNETSVLKDGFAIALGQDYADLPVGCVQYFTSFCLDKFGSDIENVFPDPPSYDKVYYKTLPEQAGVSQNRRMLSCFNCDGDHKLADCPKPRDLARISMRRRERGMNESRYHKGQDQLKLYQHLKPGIISDTLREALGMSDHDLPPYIYRMRLLDYPSGWLPGSQDHSGIVMYGKEGREEQIDKREDSDDHVHYPGFNVPIPDGCRDLAYEVRLPSMQHRHQLKVNSESESRKRKASSEGFHETKRSRTSSDNDMEVEDDGPPGTSCVIESIEELEDGEIANSPENTAVTGQPSWWLKTPLVPHYKKGTQEFVPPPFPLIPLPLHKISQILPGELNHISFEDSRWLDPVFGNVQVRTGRFEKLKKILSVHENKRKSL